MKKDALDQNLVLLIMDRSLILGGFNRGNLLLLHCPYK